MLQAFRSFVVVVDAKAGDFRNNDVASGSAGAGRSLACYWFWHGICQNMTENQREMRGEAYKLDASHRDVHLEGMIPRGMVRAIQHDTILGNGDCQDNNLAMALKRAARSPQLCDPSWPANGRELRRRRRSEGFMVERCTTASACFIDVRRRRRESEKFWVGVGQFQSGKAPLRCT
jgi:hypothetical protein